MFSMVQIVLHLSLQKVLDGSKVGDIICTGVVVICTELGYVR